MAFSVRGHEREGDGGQAVVALHIEVHVEEEEGGDGRHAAECEHGRLMGESCAQNVGVTVISAQNSCALVAPYPGGRTPPLGLRTVLK